jgi:hypothetical protein
MSIELRRRCILAFEPYFMNCRMNPVFANGTSYEFVMVTTEEEHIELVLQLRYDYKVLLLIPI